MYENHIADITLAPEGEKKIRWAAGHMPVLAAIAEDFRETKPLAGLHVALSVHLEAKTAWLCRVMEMGGAEMHVTGSNPLSTQDDVAAALAAGGMHVCAVHGATAEQYQSAIDAVLETAPNIIIDDGGDLVHRMHTKYPELISQVIGRLRGDDDRYIAPAGDGPRRGAALSDDARQRRGLQAPFR